MASGTRRTRDNIVRALVPTRADARDVMQEVTIVLWRKIGELSAMEDFQRWAFVDAAYTPDVRNDALAASAGRSAIALYSPPGQDCRGLLRNPTLDRGAIHDNLCQSKPAEEYKALYRIRLALMDCTQRVLARSESSSRWLPGGLRVLMY